MQSTTHTCPADRPPAPPPRDSSRSQSATHPLPPNGRHNQHHPHNIPHNHHDHDDYATDDIEVDDDLLLLDEDCDLMIDCDDDDNLMPDAPPTKHFLDYDAQPPPGFEAAIVAPALSNASEPTQPSSIDAESTQLLTSTVYPGEARRVAKMYETDGEISDFELATYSQTMRARRAEKALSSESTTTTEAAAQQPSMAPRSPPSPQPTTALLRRRKHFLDVNPIAPDDEEHCVSSIPVANTTALSLSDAEREHRSLDRCYERAKDQPTSSSQLRPPRKHSFSAGANSSVMQASTASSASVASSAGRRRETSFALARFLEHDPQVAARSGNPNSTWPLGAASTFAQHESPNAQRRRLNHSGSERPPHASSLTGSCVSSSSAAAAALGSSAISGAAPPKVECVYSLLSMLGCNDPIVMARKFLELSQTPESCASLRQARSIPLIVQIIHSEEADEETRRSATRALHNVVNAHPDDKAGRREAKVLRHIELVMEYCDALKQMLCAGEALADDRDRHPLQAMSSLMKISFDEEHRHAMCQLGALQAIASVVQYDHAMHGGGDDRCVALRRYAAMALTNLTFGDGNNKAALCANRDFMRAFVGQLTAQGADDLLPVTANVLRNLSWRADGAMKQVLSEIGTVSALMQAVMGGGAAGERRQESTIKALLSALWNLSAHCVANKAEICAVDGALAFLVDMLQYEGPSRTLTIVENAGGVLRNVSKQIAVTEAYRRILRQRNCLAILLAQLSSESLTIVSNACGTLWNLSARCPEDQRFLIDNRAVPRLSLLVHSKHKMISNGSSAALKNLLNFRPEAVAQGGQDSVAKAMRLRELPQLTARRQKAFAAELDQTLAETCENIEITTPPKEHQSLGFMAAAATASRLSKSDIGSAAARSLMTRCETNGSLVSLTAAAAAAGRSFGLGRPQSHSSPTTPKRTPVAVRKFVVQPQQPRYQPQQDTNPDQITDFAARYGGERIEIGGAGDGDDESPEKCVQYAEEGTPRAFQSYQSLYIAQQRNAEVDEVLTVVTETTILTAEAEADDPALQPSESALQTPLMFSRRSSLGSLSSVELPPDGAVSVATSDRSRFVSGAMSPSELPDSPSQMMNVNEVEARQQLPQNKQLLSVAAAAANDEESLSSMDSNVEDRVIFQQAIHIGSKAAIPMFNNPDPFSSIDSVDSHDVGHSSANAALLEQCIQMGIHKTTRPPSTMASRLPLAPTASPKRSQLPMPRSSNRLQTSATAADNVDVNSSSLHSDHSPTCDRSNEYPAAMTASSATDATDDVAAPSTDMLESNEFMLDERELQNSCPSTATEEAATVSSTISDKHRDPDLMLQSVDRLTQELVSAAEYLRSSAASSDSQKPASNSTATTVRERKSSSSNTWNEDTCPNDVSFPSISWTTPAQLAGDDDEDEDPTLSKSAKRAESPKPFASLGFVSQPDSLDTTTTTDTATLMNEEDRSLVSTASAEVASNRTAEEPATTTPTAPSIPSTDSTGIRFQVGGPTFRGSGFQLATPGAGRPHYAFDAAASSAMTKSTIIALEANKLLMRMPDPQLQSADSCSSLDALEDVRPPSGMDSCSGYFESQPTSMLGGFSNNGPASMVTMATTVGGGGAAATNSLALAAGPIAPMFSPQLARRKKSLPVGLMARRALHQFAVGGSVGAGGGGGGGGSLESVHSSCILENVKPPSIMDELMDSMISVASITSEVASPDISHYDTAVSQILRHDDEPDDPDDDRTQAPDDDDDDDDEDTTTLRSCFDHPLQSSAAAAAAAAAGLLDASALPPPQMTSSTHARKMRSIRRALTLKQKRQATKERYRTYTIAADMMLLDSADDDEASVRHADGDHDDHDDHDNAEVVDDDDHDNDDDDDDDATYVHHSNDDNAGVGEKLDENKPTSNAKTVDIEIVEGKRQQATTTSTTRLTPRQRRQEDRVRFQTQIIESFHLESLKKSPEIHTPISPAHLGDITTSSGSNSLDDDADMASIRALTERFRYINATPTAAAAALAPAPEPAEPQLNFAYGSPTAPQPTYTNANRNLDTIVATEFDSLEFSADEAEPQADRRDDEDDAEDAHDIDPPTYLDDQTYILPAAPAAAPAPAPKPKIVKPSAIAAIFSTAPPVVAESAPAAADPAASKAIRGKKKAAYVSPYRKSASTSPHPRPTSAPGSQSAVKPRPAAAISKLMATAKSPAGGGGGSTTQVSKLVARTHVLLNKSKLQATTRAAPTKEPASPPSKMPERQGTFVKEEPSELPAGTAAAAVPVVLSGSPAKCPSKLPAKSLADGSPTKTPQPFVSRLRNPLQRSASTTATPTIAKSAASKATASTQLAESASAAAKRRSAVGGGGGNGGTFYRSPSTPHVPQRSNSNASLRSNGGGGGSSANVASAAVAGYRNSQPPSRSNSNLSSRPLAGVTSRIAGIWRKPAAESGGIGKVATTTTTTTKVAATSKVPPSAQGALIRSSTFDNTPTEALAAEVAAARTTKVATSERASMLVPLRRRPNGVVVPPTASGVKDPADKKRLSRLVEHHYTMMSPTPRLY